VGGEGGLGGKGGAAERVRPPGAGEATAQSAKRAERRRSEAGRGVARAIWEVCEQGTKEEEGNRRSLHRRLPPGARPGAGSGALLAGSGAAAVRSRRLWALAVRGSLTLGRRVEPQTALPLPSAVAATTRNCRQAAHRRALRRRGRSGRTEAAAC